MADDADSKSVAGNRVWVQVPLPALTKFVRVILENQQYAGYFFLPENIHYYIKPD